MIIDDFFKNRKLRKITSDLDKTEQSVKIAENKLNEAKELFKAEFYAQAILSSYTSMFHIARALLYKDGIQEKSHYAVYFYLKDKYGGILSDEMTEAFLNHQNERKEILYGFDYEATRQEAESCIDDAELFLVKIKEILK